MLKRDSGQTRRASQRSIKKDIQSAGYTRNRTYIRRHTTGKCRAALILVHPAIWSRAVGPSTTVAEGHIDIEAPFDATMPSSLAPRAQLRLEEYSGTLGDGSLGLQEMCEDEIMMHDVIHFGHPEATWPSTPQPHRSREERAPVVGEWRAEGAHRGDMPDLP